MLSQPPLSSKSGPSPNQVAPYESDEIVVNQTERGPLSARRGGVMSAQRHIILRAARPATRGRGPVAATAGVEAAIAPQMQIDIDTIDKRQVHALSQQADVVAVAP